MAVAVKAQCKSIPWPVITLSGMYPRERTTCVHQKRHIRMFIAALLIIVKTQTIQMFISRKMDKLTVA